MKKYDFKTVIIYLLIFAVIMALSYLMTTAILYLICKCFDLDIWSWKTSLGLWLALILVNGIHVARGDKY